MLTFELEDNEGKAIILSTAEIQTFNVEACDNTQMFFVNYNSDLSINTGTRRLIQSFNNIEGVTKEDMFKPVELLTYYYRNRKSPIFENWAQVETYCKSVSSII